MNEANVLISSAGRRVGLLECIRDSMAAHGLVGKLLTIDSVSSAPATFVSESVAKVPRCTDPGFLGEVQRLCVEHRIALLIPTIDTELPIYAAAREQLAEIGVVACISNPATVDICSNKVRTHAWLSANGFPTVRQTDVRSALLNPSDWPLPLIVKPSNGSASLGVQRIRSRRELAAMEEMEGEYIVQEIAEGREFTINVYVSRSGECVCAIPHWRMEIRAGEVSKGLTVKDHQLMENARAIAEALPGARGPLNIQCFMDGSDTIRVIEINARFGGGYPLAHHAGGRFTDWLFDELQGKRLSYTDGWENNIAMLRYDQAIFVPGHRIHP